MLPQPVISNRFAETSGLPTACGGNRVNDGDVRTELRFVVPALAMTLAAAAMLVLVFQATPWVLDYETGLVPWGVPLVAAALAVAVAELGMAPGFGSSVLGTVLSLALLVMTGWAVAQLLFDALRLVGLVPLPLSWWGFGLRLLLLAAAAAALLPVAAARREELGRCADCGRVLPGPLARVPRWPIAVGLLFALPYPAFRISWLLGGSFGRTGAAPGADPVLEGSMAGAGVLLVAVALVLLVGRGPGWLRAGLGIGSMLVGALLAVTFAPAAVAAAVSAVTGGQSADPGLGMAGWIPLLFYGSWPLAGLGVALGGWRYWVGRRADCAGCRHLLAG